MILLCKDCKHLQRGFLHWLFNYEFSHCCHPLQTRSPVNGKPDRLVIVERSYDTTLCKKEGGLFKQK